MATAMERFDLAIEDLKNAQAYAQELLVAEPPVENVTFTMTRVPFALIAEINRRHALVDDARRKAEQAAAMVQGDSVV